MVVDNSAESFNESRCCVVFTPPFNPCDHQPSGQQPNSLSVFSAR